jgi:hypothetical protein
MNISFYFDGDRPCIQFVGVGGLEERGVELPILPIRLWTLGIPRPGDWLLPELPLEPLPDELSAVLLDAQLLLASDARAVAI